MIDNDKKDDLILIVEADSIDQNKEIKPIIVSRSAGSHCETPKSILKTSSKLSKSFDQPPIKQPILKRHSFDVCFPSTTKNTTHSILKHSHSSNDEDAPINDDQKPIKPILKKASKSFEHFQDANQLANIKPILKKKEDARSDSDYF